MSMKIPEWLNPFQSEQKAPEKQPEASNSNANNNTVASSQQYTPPVNATVSFPTSTNPVTDPDIEKHFQELLEASNMKGVDYYEFKKAISATPAGTMTEQTLFQTTFNALSMGAGLTKPVLLSAIEYYTKIVNDDKASFDKTVTSKLATQVTAIRSKVTENSQRVEKLQEEINKLQQENIKLQNDASTNEMQINKAKHLYIITVQNVLGIFESDKNKINQYIS